MKQKLAQIFNQQQPLKKTKLTINQPNTNNQQPQQQLQQQPPSTHPVRIRRAVFRAKKSHSHRIAMTTKCFGVLFGNDPCMYQVWLILKDFCLVGGLTSLFSAEKGVRREHFSRDITANYRQIIALGVLRRRLLAHLFNCHKTSVTIYVSNII